VPAGSEWNRPAAFIPYAVPDGAGEIYFLAEPNGFPIIDLRDSKVVIHAPESQSLMGRMYVPNKDLSGMVALRFTAPNNSAAKCSQNVAMDRAAFRGRPHA